jgi:type III pantothenate kinase
VSGATLDVGNSSIGLVLWRESDPGSVERLGTPEEAALRLRNAGMSRCAAISVAPRRLDELLRCLGDRASGVAVLTDPPVELGAPALLASAGADRIANMLGVESGAAIVVDAGTAVTVDLLDETGTYVGGYIAPGPAAAAGGLAEATARLPKVPGQPTSLMPGGVTEAALSSGVWGLTVGGVDRLVEEALEVLGGESVRIVATGGWGQAWVSDSRHTGVRWQPDLVHRGIARWAGWA